MFGIDVPRLRRELAGSDKMPLDFNGEWFGHPCYHRGGRAFVGLFNIRIVQSVPKYNKEGHCCKSSTHRVWIQCNECHDWYPAGRWHQHMKAHRKEVTTA
jgi:hypothetical protein